MTRHIACLTLAACCWMGGCAATEPGTTRPMGAVAYQVAFANGRQVMAQYFSVEHSNPETGVIRSRPMLVDEPQGERLLGSSPARKLATLRLRQEGGQVVAHASIAVQREGSASQRQFNPAANPYDGVPNKSPARIEAANTPEQVEAWQTVRYDHATEREMLDDLYDSLHGEPPEE